MHRPQSVVCYVPHIHVRQLPMLLVWGTGDEMMAPQHLQWWLDHLPEHARVERPDGYGHSPFLECPELLADLILDHCERL